MGACFFQFAGGESLTWGPEPEETEANCAALSPACGSPPADPSGMDGEGDIPGIPAWGSAGWLVGWVSLTTRYTLISRSSLQAVKHKRRNGIQKRTDLIGKSGFVGNTGATFQPKSGMEKRGFRIKRIIRELKSQSH